MTESDCLKKKNFSILSATSVVHYLFLLSYFDLTFNYYKKTLEIKFE